MNDYIDMLADRVDTMLRENVNMHPEEALEEIIFQDNMNGSIEFDIDKDKEFYEKALSDNWMERHDFGAWIDDTGLSAEVVMYYMGNDYGKLNVLAETYVAETYKKEILKNVKEQSIESL